MTAQELIQKLQQLPPETRIVIRGYEDGYNDILRLIPLMIIPHPEQKADYYGEYTSARDKKEKTGQSERSNCMVKIPRQRNDFWRYEWLERI